MHIVPLLEGVEFNDRRPHASPLVPGLAARVVSFALRAGQSLRAHNALGTTVFLFVIKGRAFFGGRDAVCRVDASSLVVVEAGETYTVRAVDDLVFVAVRGEGPPPSPDVHGEHEPAHAMS
jgi:quercetin dioxygenase-like cupin family protein